VPGQQAEIFQIEGFLNKKGGKNSLNREDKDPRCLENRQRVFEPKG
jgi:hypothetical protein